LQNPHIVSIFPQSHRLGVDVSSSPNNCNASLLREGCARAAACCTVRCSRHRGLPRSSDVLDGPANFVGCFARRFLCR
jgi:hypothetical protein